jgi:hypothetical protein
MGSKEERASADEKWLVTHRAAMSGCERKELRIDEVEVLNVALR